MLDDEREIFELIYDIQFYADHLINRTDDADDLLDLGNIIDTTTTLRDKLREYMERLR